MRYPQDNQAVLRGSSQDGLMDPLQMNPFRMDPFRKSPFRMLDAKKSPSEFSPEGFEKSNLAKFVAASFSQKFWHIYSFLYGSWKFLSIDDDYDDDYYYDPVLIYENFGILDWLGLMIPNLTLMFLDFSMFLTSSNNNTKFLSCILFVPLYIMFLVGLLNEYLLKPILAFVLSVASAVTILPIIHLFTSVYERYVLSQIDEISKKELNNFNGDADLSLISNDIFRFGSNQDRKEISYMADLRNGSYSLTLFKITEENSGSYTVVKRECIGKKDYASKEELESSSLFQNIMRIA